MRVRKKKKNALEIPRTQGSAHPPMLQIIHQLDETRLRLLCAHGGPLNGLDFICRDECFLGRQVSDVL